MKHIRLRIGATPSYQAAYVLPERSKERARLMAQAAGEQRATVRAVDSEGVDSGVPVWFCTEADGRKTIRMKCCGSWEEVMV